MNPVKHFFKQVLIMLIAGALLAWVMGCGQPTYYRQPVVVQQPSMVIQQPVQSVPVQEQYEYMVGPDGVEQAAFWDAGIRYVVLRSLFDGWMNNGGYGYVVHHYHDNPSYYHTYDTRTYSNYRVTSRGSYNSYRAPSGFRSNNSSNPSQFRNTSPASSPSGFRGSNSSTPSTFRNTSPSVPKSGFRSSSPSASSSRSSPSGGFRRH